MKTLFLNYSDSLEMLGALSELIKLRDKDKYPELEEIFVKIDGSAELKKLRDAKLALCFYNLVQTVSRLPGSKSNSSRIGSELNIELTDEE